MTSNSEVILRRVVKDKHEATAPMMKVSDYFESFVAELVLADARASYEEIVGGLVGGGGDGGIDGLWTYVDGRPILSKEDIPDDFSKESTVELVVVQAKFQGGGFSEEAIRKIRATLDDVLNLDRNLDSLRSVYSSVLLDAISRFRDTYTAASTRFPHVRIRVVYASCAAESTNISPQLEFQISLLRDNLVKKLNDAVVEVNLLGARNLLKLLKSSQAETLKVSIAETPISTERGGYVALVALDDYYRFLVDENGNLRGWLFDYNVRDYEGPTVTVNQAIKSTLESHDDQSDFWWLNNGVSILAEEVSSVGKTLVMAFPRIVNGLQTSMEIFNHYSRGHHSADDTRKILIRVIKATDDDSRNKIIKATNSQTLIPSIALRSTEPIHADIEDYLCYYDFWYERRQNKYKTEGKALKKIVTIPSLAEAVLATAFTQPHLGTARGGRFLKDDEVYSMAFNRDYPLALYLNAIRVVRRVDDYIDSLEREVRSQYFRLSYFAAATVVAKNLRCWCPGPLAMAKLDVEALSDSDIGGVFLPLGIELRNLVEQYGPRYDIIGPELLNTVRTALNL